MIDELDWVPIASGLTVLGDTIAVTCMGKPSAKPVEALNTMRVSSGQRIPGRMLSNSGYSIKATQPRMHRAVGLI